jgi:hypothetical protein
LTVPDKRGEKEDIGYEHRGTFGLDFLGIISVLTSRQLDFGDNTRYNVPLSPSYDSKMGWRNVVTVQNKEEREERKQNVCRVWTFGLGYCSRQNSWF